MTREEAIMWIKTLQEDAIFEVNDALLLAIKALSEWDPKIPGKWIDLDECSVCGKQAIYFIDGVVCGIEYLPNFCPNCGAKMK